MPEDEYSEHVWGVIACGDMLGVADSLDKAETVLRAAYLSNQGWKEEEVGDRLTFDLKFNTWILFFDRLPQWSYNTYKVPML